MAKKKNDKIIKKDAPSLAYLLYDIYKDSRKNVIISNGQNNAQTINRNK